MSDHRTQGLEPERETDHDGIPARRLRRFTSSPGRRGLLSAVAIALLIVFLAAPTTKIYLDQQAEIEQLQTSIEQKSADRDELEDELERWENPDYVRQQAGERLMMVEPDQRSYLVVGAEEVGSGAPDTSAVEESAGSPAWADALWGSLKDSAWPQRTQDGGAGDFPELGEQQDPAQGDPTSSETPEPTD